MNLAAVITRIHLAIVKSRVCHRHSIRLINNACSYCLLESWDKQGRFHPTMVQVTNGVVAPSWERKQL